MFLACIVITTYRCFRKSKAENSSLQETLDGSDQIAGGPISPRAEAAASFDNSSVGSSSLLSSLKRKGMPWMRNKDHESMSTHISNNNSKSLSGSSKVEIQPESTLASRFHNLSVSA